VKVDKYFKKWSKRIGKSVDEIREEYQGIVEELRKNYPDQPKSVIERSALSLLREEYGRLYGSLRSGAEVQRGFIVADAGLFDEAEVIRSRVQRVIREHGRTYAEQEGLIDRDGVILDTRPTVFGRDNPNFGNPLPEHIFSRTLYGTFIIDDKPRAGRIRIFGDAAVNVEYHFFRPFEARLIRKDDFSGLVTFNASRATSFKAIDEEWDIPGMIYSSWDVESIGDFIDDLQKQPKQRMSLCVVEGEVADLNLTPSKTGRRYMRLSGPDLDIGIYGVKCWIPQYVPVSFSQLDYVIVWGRGRMRDGVPMVDVYGVYPKNEKRLTLKREPVYEFSITWSE